MSRPTRQIPSLVRVSAGERIGARRTLAVIRDAGPYDVHSCADGTIVIRPTWPKEPPLDKYGAGGPGVLSRMSLAECIAERLNGMVRKVTRCPTHAPLHRAAALALAVWLVGAFAAGVVVGMVL